MTQILNLYSILHFIIYVAQFILFFLHTVIRNILFTFATQSPSDSIYFLLADREREILDCQLRKINQTNIHVYDIHRQQV